MCVGSTVEMIKMTNNEAFEKWKKTGNPATCSTAIWDSACPECAFYAGRDSISAALVEKIEKRLPCMLKEVIRVFIKEERTRPEKFWRLLRRAHELA